MDVSLQQSRFYQVKTKKKLGTNKTNILDKIINHSKNLSHLKPGIIYYNYCKKVVIYYRFNIISTYRITTMFSARSHIV